MGSVQRLDRDFAQKVAEGFGENWFRVERSRIMGKKLEATIFFKIKGLLA